MNLVCFQEDSPMTNNNNRLQAKAQAATIHFKSGKFPINNSNYGDYYHNCNTLNGWCERRTLILEIICSELHPLSASALIKAVSQGKPDLAIALLQNEGIPCAWAIQLLRLVNKELGGES